MQTRVPVGDEDDIRTPVCVAAGGCLAEPFTVAGLVARGRERTAGRAG